MRNAPNIAVLKNRIKSGTYISGVNSVLNILRDENEYQIDYLLTSSNSNSSKISEAISLAKQQKIQVVRDSKLLYRAEREFSLDSGGVILVSSRRLEKYSSLKTVLSSNSDKIVVIAVGDLDYEQNLGSIIRTSAGLGADFLLVPNGQQKIFSPTVTKISMGYNYLLPVIRENFLLAIERLKENGFEIIGFDMDGENIASLRYNSRVCILIGNEGKGLSETILKKCDKIASIPMQNNVESINVSVALGIALYDCKVKLNEIKRAI